MKHLFLACAIFTLSSLGAISQAAGGNGIQGDPYLIETCQEFVNINNDLDAYYILANDLDCISLGSGIMVGDSSDPFEGSLDGNGHSIAYHIESTQENIGLFRVILGASISNLELSGYVHSTDSQIGGLAGYIQNESIIENISGTVVVHGHDLVGGLAGTTADNQSFTGINIQVQVVGSNPDINNGKVGGIVGESYDIISISDTNVSGQIQALGDYVGGLVGWLFTGHIVNSHVTGSIQGNEQLGGLIGILYEGSIDSSSSHVDIQGLSTIGGLIGNAGVQTPINIQDSYAIVNLVGTDEYGSIGGLVGSLEGNIIRSYALGNASGVQDVGGLVGSMYDFDGIGNIVSESYADMHITGYDNIGGLIGYIQEASIENSYALGSIYLESDYGYAGGAIGLLNGGTGTNIYANTVIYASEQADEGIGGLVGYGDIIIGSYWNIDINEYNNGLGLGVTSQELKDIDLFLTEGRDIEETDLNINNGYPFLSRQVGDSTPVWYQYQPTPIETCEDFKNIENDLGGDYRLTQDLDCTSYTRDEIMVVTSPYASNYFSGTFDGAGYMIEIDLTRNDHLALFGKAVNANIINLTVSGSINANVNGGGGMVASIIASAENVVLENIHFIGDITVESIGTYLGGLIGIGHDLSFIDSSIEGNFTGYNIFGGLLSQVTYATNGAIYIENSEVSGSLEITSSDQFGSLGGFIGSLADMVGDITITGSTVSSDTSFVGVTQVGGLIGYACREDGTIEYLQENILDNNNTWPEGLEAFGTDCIGSEGNQSEDTPAPQVVSTSSGSPRSSRSSSNMGSTSNLQSRTFTAKENPLAQETQVTEKTDDTKTTTNTNTNSNSSSSTEQTICLDTEYQDAYLFAFQYSITTMPSCAQADMDGTLIRAHAAKMMTNYAMNILNKTPDTDKACIFDDMQDQTEELQNYAILACQLGLMGLASDGVTPASSFNPDRTIDKAQFTTILSRLLYGPQYDNNQEEFRIGHVQAMQDANIITSTTDLFDPLRRAFAMIMLMRAQK